MERMLPHEAVEETATVGNELFIRIDGLKAIRRAEVALRCIESIGLVIRKEMSETEIANLNLTL